MVCSKMNIAMLGIISVANYSVCINNRMFYELIKIYASGYILNVFRICKPIPIYSSEYVFFLIPTICPISCQKPVGGVVMEFS